MANSKPVLVRDIEIGKIYAHPKSKEIIGRLKEKTINSYYGMHREPIFNLVFEFDVFSNPIVMSCDWADELYETIGPIVPSLFEKTKTVIKQNPDKFETNDVIENIMGIEDNKYIYPPKDK
uniref:Uncharacterized protein n=1 Tax=viral metagenome TaxID=1070528 RepID=A0A6C0D3F1_9ZZZZ